MYLELTHDNLDKVLAQYDKTFVMYGAEWCDACVDSKPHFKKLSEENKDIAFIFSNSDKFIQIKEYVNFEFIPTFVAFEKDNVIDWRETSYKEEIELVLEKITQLSI